MSAARSWERREGIIDLLCVHFLRHLLQVVHCRWDVGAAEPLVCHSVARLMPWGKIRAGRESGVLDISRAVSVKAVQHAWQDGEQADAHL